MPAATTSIRARTFCAGSASARSGWCGSIRKAAWPGVLAIPRCRATRPFAASCANAPPQNSSSARDRIGLPVDAGDPGIVEGHALIQRPAHRLHDRALDLVGQAIRIDDLTAVDRGDRPDQMRAPGLAIDFHFGRNRAISREILVTRK